MSADEADAFVHAVARDWRSAPLSLPDRALCEYADKLTHHPADMTPEDLDRLREHSFDDRAIHDAAQVIGFGVVGSLVAGVVYFVLTLAAVDQAIATRFAPKELLDSVEGRLARTTTGFLIWAESPIIGVGDA